MKSDRTSDLARAIRQIPSSSGSYTLLIELPEAQTIQIGHLGAIAFPAGDYVYLGSARGTGGLRARLGRHLRGPERLHWHIDDLRAFARVSGYCYLETAAEEAAGEATKPLECRWSTALAEFPEISTPAPRFGASDCRSGCPAHLFRVPKSLAFVRLQAALASAAGVSHQALICRAGFLG